MSHEKGPAPIGGVKVVKLAAAALLCAGMACTAAAAAARDGLPNPERGFRFEIRVGREAGEKLPRSVRNNWPFAAYAQDGVRVAQAYCYLNRYCDAPIPQTKLDALQADFDKARRDGVKFLFRFAYETDMSRTKGPSLARILSHIRELSAIVRRNADVIYAFQIGWVGAWGEFHSSASGIEFDRAATARVVKDTIDCLLPTNRATMLRTMQLRENVLADLGDDGARIGLFNDATLADFHDSGTFMGDRNRLMKMAWDDILGTRFSEPGNPQFELLGKIGAHVPVDGELFWIGNVDPVRQNGLDALIRLRRHHYTTFSLVHGNSELDMNSGRDIGPIDTWKKTPVTADLLAALGIPSDPAYFAGVPYRTAYEYIRDHLGYRLVAKDARWADGTARVTLHNYGFAAPINPRRAVFVVLAADGTATECPTDFDCRALEPETDVTIAGPVPTPKAGDRLALWLPDAMPSLRLRPDYAIRLAGGSTVETVGGRLLNVLPCASAASDVAAGADEPPFSALRFGYRCTQPDKWPAMRAALEKNRTAFDEVWFSTGVSFPALDWHEEHARQCAAAADDLRRLGIMPSIEIQTILGHTDEILAVGDNAGQDWGTMVSCEGRAARHLGCPRDPKLRAYFVRVGELHAAWKPGSVWVDDDLSYRNRAPVSDPSKALPGCFCDRCLDGFVRREGRAWACAELAAAIRADADVRRRWDAYSCEGYGELTRAIAVAVHRLSPKTVFGYQYGGRLYPEIPRGLFDGSGIPVRLRPGAGSYWDSDAFQQIDKAYALQTMLRGVRGQDWVGAVCPEIETCPRTFACRTPQGVILEAFENLALGMDFLSLFVADLRTDESPAFYADDLFPRLASAHPFLKGYRDANRGTRPCGFTVSGDYPPRLVPCRGVPVVGADGLSLGSLPDLATIPIRMLGSGTVDTASPDYQTRVMQIASSTGLKDYYARCDRASGGRLPVLFASPVRAFVVPRVRADGSLATVALVNASIDRQESVEVSLRGVPKTCTAVRWFAPEETPVDLPLVRDGTETRVRLPRLGAWTCGYLSVD